MKHDFYRNLNLQYKLFLQYLLLLAIAFTLFIALNYRITSKDLEAQAKYSSQQVFEQSRSFLEYKLYVAENYLTILASNERMQDILHRDASYYLNHYGLWSFDVEDIRKQFYITKPSEDIIKTSLYTAQAVASANETDDVMRMTRIEAKPWYASLQRSTSTFELFPNTIQERELSAERTDTFSIARSIYDNENFRNVLGVLTVDIPRSLFASILDRVAFSENSSVYLINRAGQPIARSSTSAAGDVVFKPDMLDAIPAVDLKAGDWRKRSLDGMDYLVGAQNVADTDWYLVSLTPYKEIVRSQRKAMKQMLLLTFLIGLFLLPLAFVAASSTTRRIRRLISQMKSVKKGDFAIRVQHDGKDEIGELGRNFQTMIAKVSQLLDEKYTLGQEVKSMELKALQAQINPHFLYNTLDLIYWKALRIQEQSIYELVQSLSKFYKLSLSKGEDIVCLRSEIEHIVAYIDIQNARFKNGIRLVIDIPDELYDRPMPKITLQPLVENAIIHGILETEEETGTITVSAAADGGKFVIRVADNGVGMSEARIGTMFAQETDDPSRGYGAGNINTRIKLLHGEEYGLSYRRHEGPGISAIIELPL